MSAAVTTGEWLYTSAGHTDAILINPMTGVGSLYTVEMTIPSVKTTKTASSLSLAWGHAVKDDRPTALTILRKDCVW